MELNLRPLPPLQRMERLTSLGEQGMVVVRGWGSSIDRWVARNVAKETQTYLMFGLVLVMVIHLVYTKRRVVREVKEEQEEAARQEAKKKT